MKSITKCFFLVAALASFAPASHAIPQIRLFDGTSTVTLTDGGINDAQPAAGQAVFVGALGNWTLNVHVGTTYPVLGTLENPVLDLSFNATSNGAGGTLWVSFSTDGFGPTLSLPTAAIGGTIASGGSLTYATYGGTNNTLFSTATLLTSQGPFGPGAFSGTVAGSAVSSVGPYSLTQIVGITHGAGAAQTTGNALLTIAVPDGGSTLLFLGAALLAGAGIIRLRSRKTLV